MPYPDLSYKAAIHMTPDAIARCMVSDLGERLGQDYANAFSALLAAYTKRIADPEGAIAPGILGDRLPWIYQLWDWEWAEQRLGKRREEALTPHDFYIGSTAHMSDEDFGEVERWPRYDQGFNISLINPRCGHPYWSKPSRVLQRLQADEEPAGGFFPSPFLIECCHEWAPARMPRDVVVGTLADILPEAYPFVISVRRAGGIGCEIDSYNSWDVKQRDLVTYKCASGEEACGAPHEVTLHKLHRQGVVHLAHRRPPGRQVLLDPNTGTRTSAEEKRLLMALRRISPDFDSDSIRLRWRSNSRASLDAISRSLKVVVEFDGGRHQGREAIDEAKTTALIADGYRVVRVRDRKLGMLSIQDTSLLQLAHTHGDEFGPLVEAIRVWIHEARHPAAS